MLLIPKPANRMSHRKCGRVVACVQTNGSKDHYARNDAHRPDALFELLPEGGGRVALSRALCVVFLGVAAATQST